ncbi:glycosyltransferase [Vibrio parahaemolyticus]|uniref:Glycosyl transferase domain protein n=1 Tax=Vibrio parahaemolyticus TaxID=670 RepID=A0A5Q5AX88_VIBPH|nr:glycosyltransferase [Vibrio parahaemolyticus]EGQ8479789.1 glycosyltransferase [Vibrio parahaemolyticus]EGR1280599.1 glycosyltransferase [Vibrio parahaemolyticus]EGR1790059.1 glycosyltransferase [Vibrio parahaemolyticus]EGR1936186.1 glycosyltransferase [Vibrio parahaemolyticus]EGR3452947.1 glycosyl transferase family 2 [Vibrio parahaemolyticus]
MPLVSVVLPIYNAEKYLHLTLDSVISQTYLDIEVICINDGSTDNTQAILEDFKKRDDRIRIINRENKGLVYSLNQGISISKGKYIARMDADDICLPKRFEMQVKFLESNPSVGLVGTSYMYIDENDNQLSKRIVPRSLSIIRSMLLFGSPICHPSVMFNKSIVGEHLLYDENYDSCEDLELWFRLNDKGIEIRNLSDVLIKYRILPTSISSRKMAQQKERTNFLKNQYIGISSHDLEHICGSKTRNRFLWTLKNLKNIGCFSGFVGVSFSILYAFKHKKNIRC